MALVVDAACDAETEGAKESDTALFFLFIDMHPAKNKNARTFQLISSPRKLRNDYSRAHRSLLIVFRNRNTGIFFDPVIMQTLDQKSKKRRDDSLHPRIPWESTRHR